MGANFAYILNYIDCRTIEQIITVEKYPTKCPTCSK